MSKPLRFVLTHDTVNVVVDGKTYTVREGAANFNSLRQALFDQDWDTARKCLTPTSGLEQWAGGLITVEGETFYYQGEALPRELNARVLLMAGMGQDPEPLFLFWDRLQENPSMRSVQQLFPFLQHQGIPLTKDGCFLAYKGVNEDFTDCHTGKVNNSPGNIHQMRRNKISDDPNQACHYGFHVGAFEYARSFGSRVLVCKVDPADVVCIPYDSSQQKMRVCRYKVVAEHHGTHLPSSVVDLEEAVDIHNPMHGVEPDEEESETPTPPGYWDVDNPDMVKNLDLSDFEEEEEPEEVVDDTPEDPKPRKLTPAEKRKHRKSQTEKLMQMPMDVLRKKAVHVYKIKGAHRLPGGKKALVKAIVDKALG